MECDKAAAVQRAPTEVPWVAVAGNVGISLKPPLPPSPLAHPEGVGEVVRVKVREAVLRDEGEALEPLLPRGVADGRERLGYREKEGVRRLQPCHPPRQFREAKRAEKVRRGKRRAPRGCWTATAA